MLLLLTLNLQIRRGSFLRRSDKDLSAIATLTKSVLPVQAPKNGNNFVFASITPERPTNTVKRKNKKEVGFDIYHKSCVKLKAKFFFLCRLHRNLKEMIYQARVYRQQRNLKFLLILKAFSLTFNSEIKGFKK